MQKGMIHVTTACSSIDCSHTEILHIAPCNYWRR
jgi:hypothetical protein